MKIRLASPVLMPDSIVDGEGIRAVLWTQGCRHKCPGCQNPQTHSFEDGFIIDIEEIKQGDYLNKIDKYFNSFYQKKETEVRDTIEHTITDLLQIKEIL